LACWEEELRKRRKKNPRPAEGEKARRNWVAAAIPGQRRDELNSSRSRVWWLGFFREVQIVANWNWNWNWNWEEWREKERWEIGRWEWKGRDEIEGWGWIGEGGTINADKWDGIGHDSLLHSVSEFPPKHPALYYFLSWSVYPFIFFL